MGILKIGETYRYSKKLSPELKTVEGYPNFLNVTHLEAYPKPLMERGIASIAASGSSSWNRAKPAILISSTPSKSGSEETPWRDNFDLESGKITYYGDNKTFRDPSLAPGNRALLREFAFHSSGEREIRAQATPLIFFLRVPVGSRRKGFVEFVGIGILKSAELKTQYFTSHGFFPNYLFGFSLLSLEEEGHQLNWSWINDRRSSEPRASEKLAPKSWTEWVRSGIVRSNGS